MKKVSHTLVSVTGGYVFQPEKGEKSQKFNSKEEGLKVLTGLMGKDYKTSVLSPENVVELMKQIKGEARLDCFKDATKNKDEAAKGRFIVSIERSIGKAENMVKYNVATETGTPAFTVCSDCGDHGWIFTKNKIADDIHSKAEAKNLVDELMQLGEFDETGKTKLLEEINASNLPEEEPAGGETNVLSGMLIGIGPNGISVAEISVIGLRG